MTSVKLRSKNIFFLFAPAFLQISQLLHQPVQLLFHVLSQFSSLRFPTRSHPWFAKIEFPICEKHKKYQRRNYKQTIVKPFCSILNRTVYPGMRTLELSVFVELQDEGL